MTERLRAVFDTNVFVSAFLSRSPTSPTQELIRRWQADEFTLLVCDALLEEIAEKFHLTRERIRQIKEKAIIRLRHQSRSKILRQYLG